MGNTQSQNVFIAYHDPLNLEEYTKIQQCFVESLGEIHELTNTLTKDSIFLKIIRIEQELLPRNTDLLHQKFRILHPNLLKTFGSVFSQKHNKEGIYTDVMIYFESPLRSLQEEIFTRRQTQDRFPALELLVYLKNCIDVFALLEEKGCAYEHITPRTIFFSANNQLKIVHPTLLGLIDFAESIKFEKNKEITKVMCAEIRKYLGFSSKSIKSSVFTLGVTFLASALLEEEHMLYQTHNDPQTEKFRVYNQKLRSTYPSDFVNILRNMLEDDETIRPTFIELRDNLVEYMKCDFQDNQFPMSPTFPTGKKKRVRQFSESFPSKGGFKTSFSNANTLGSPINELANSQGPPEWSFKPSNNNKSFLDKLFCGFCSTNAEDELEIKPATMPNRPTKRQDILDLAARSVDNPRESIQFNTEAFEGLVKETSQQQKTIPTMLTTDRYEKYENEEMPQLRLISPNRKRDNGIQIIDYGNKARTSGTKGGHLPEKTLERQSPDLSESPQKSESPKKAVMYQNYKERIDRENHEMNKGLGMQINKGKDSSTQCLTYRDVNTTKMTMNNSITSREQKKGVQDLNKKKKSALVKKIMADYKKNSNNPNKNQQIDISRIPLEEIKTNTFSRFLESHEKPLQAHNKSFYDDELFNSHEKSKINTFSYREKDMRRRNNEDGEGIFIKPEDSVYGINIDSRLSRTRNRKSFAHSHLSSPYRDADASYRSAGMVVTRNECPACNIPFMSINRSFAYSVSTERVNREEREDAIRMNSNRKGSVRWNLANEMNSGDKKYGSPAEKKRHRDSAGYQEVVK